MKVVKFGGSSLSSASMFQQVKTIITQDDDRKIVVCSALGKDDVNTSKITDLLYLLFAHIKYHIDYETLLKTIYERFKTIQTELELDYDFDTDWDTFVSNLSTSLSQDKIVSYGEYFTGQLLASYLGFTFVDAKDLMKVSYNKQFLYDDIKKAYNNLKEKEYIVVPGFYGVTPSNDIILFSRGGSDITGSVLAHVSDATLYENFTDVSGIYTADPTIIANAAQIEDISYAELRELSYRGAHVLHDESILPLEKKKIPIVIKNTNHPTDAGTVIRGEFTAKNQLITAIAGKEDFSVINVTKRGSASKIKVLRDLLSLFVTYKINIEHIPSGIDSFSIIVSSSSLQEKQHDLVSDLLELDDIIDITIEDQVSLIAIVGRNMANIPGIAGKIFSALGEEKINIKVIAQASTELSVIVGMDSSDYNKAIRVLYKKFFT